MWSFEKFINRIACLSDSGDAITYKELQMANDELAETIDGRCLVFVLCSNTIGSVVGYTAFVRLKLVPVMLSENLDEQLLSKLMDIYSPRYVWAQKEKAKMDSLCKFDKVHESYDYILLRTGFKHEHILNKELAMLLTTSGSTGSPKFVRQSYENIKVNTTQIIEYLELTSEERAITTMPMNYTYGLSIINTHLMVGATILLTKKGLMQREFWDFFREQEATSFGGVPYTYEMLDKLKFFNMSLPKLRYMTQAGGKLPVNLHKKFAEYAKEMKKKFFVMYGSCEATARMGYLPSDKTLEKIGSFGVAIPNGKFYLVDVDEKVIQEPETEGELIYEGLNVTMGYAECGEDLALGDERHGRLETGDIAKRDSDGFYYIVGRKKRFLKVYGNRINLDDIEQLIEDRFENTECVSVGEDDHIDVFVTGELATDKVREYISQKTKLNLSAFSVHSIECIPKNESGKILYRELINYHD